MPNKEILSYQSYVIQDQPIGNDYVSCSSLLGFRVNGLAGRTISKLESCASECARLVLDCTMNCGGPILGGLFLSLAGRTIFPIADAAVLDSGAETNKELTDKTECLDLGGGDDHKVRVLSDNANSPSPEQVFQYDYPAMPNGSRWVKVQQICEDQPGGNPDSMVYAGLLRDCADGGRFSKDCPNAVELIEAVLEKHGSWQDSLRVSMLDKGPAIDAKKFTVTHTVPALPGFDQERWTFARISNAPNAQGPFYDKSTAWLWWERSLENRECIEPKWGWVGYSGTYSMRDGNPEMSHSQTQLCFNSPDSISKWEKDWMPHYLESTYKQIDAQRMGEKFPIKKIPFYGWGSGSQDNIVSNACSELQNKKCE